MWWSGEHGELFGWGGPGGRLDAADVVAWWISVEGSLGIWESSRLFCSRIESNNIGFF
jgi:hypothetical protein